MTHNVQVIQNGLVVTAENNITVYYATIDEALLGITESLRERYKESLHHEWDGEFAISISTSGLAV